MKDNRTSKAAREHIAYIEDGRWEDVYGTKHDLIAILDRFQVMEKGLQRAHAMLDIILAQNIELHDDFMPSQSDLFPIVAILNAAIEYDPKEHNHD